MNQDIQKSVNDLRHCFGSQLSVFDAALKKPAGGKLREIKVLGISLQSTGAAIILLGEGPDYFFR